MSTGEYEIARILDERKGQFLIEWTNYESPSWEAAEAIYESQEGMLSVPHSAGRVAFFSTVACGVDQRHTTVSYSDFWCRTPRGLIQRSS